MKEKSIQASVFLVLIAGMGTSSIYGIMQFFKFTIHPVQVGLIMIGISSIYIGLFLNRFSRKCTLLGLISGALAISLYLANQKLLKKFLLGAYGQGLKFMLWLQEFVRGQEINKLNYQYMLLIILGVAILLLLSIFTIKKFNLAVVISIGCVPYIVGILKRLPLHMGSLGLVIFICVLYYFYGYYLKLQNNLESEDTLDKKSYFKFFIVVACLTGILTLVYALSTPIKLKWVHNIFDKKVSARTYDHMRSFPYEGKLGGDIELKDTSILQVKGTRRTYLKAEAKSIYTGSTWRNTPQSPILVSVDNITTGDTEETLRASKFLAEKDTSNLFYKDTFEITFEELFTKSLFIPVKADSVKLGLGINKIYLNNGGELYLDQPRGKGFSYQVASYTPKYNSELLKTTLRKSKVGFYKTYKNKVTTEPSAINDEDVAYLEMLIEKSKGIQEDYTQLPKDLPQRIKDLALRLTENYTNNYDKVSALENYLAENYSYTLTPGTPKADQDFVEQFLFEDKEGYCTYFATAMAVLTRCIGLPSRYVQGYTMPVLQDEEKDYYDVQSKNAHAWVEVYFEGFGWVVFEPTARYQATFRNKPQALENTFMPDYENRPKTELENYGGGKINSLKENGLYIVRISIIILGGIGLTTCLNYYLKRRKTNRLLPREGVIYYYDKILKILYKNDKGIENGETYSTYAKRIDLLLGLYPISFEEITTTFLKARYSTQTIMEEEKLNLKEYEKNLKNKLKKKT